MQFPHPSLGPPPKALFLDGLWSNRYIQDGQNICVIASRSDSRQRDICLRLDITDRMIYDAFFDILSALVPETIRMIDLSVMTVLISNGDRLLASLTSMCPNVTYLIVKPFRNYTAGVLAQILSRLLLPVTSVGNRAEPPFPDLQGLDLTAFGSLNFSERCLDPENPRPRTMPPTLAQAFVDIMQTRRDATTTPLRVYLQEWESPKSAFGKSVLDVSRTIPGVVFSKSTG